MRSFIWAVCSAAISATCVHVWAVDKFFVYENERITLQTSEREAQQISQDLLSNGRFVRRYNPATGHSEYRFNVKTKVVQQ